MCKFNAEILQKSTSKIISIFTQSNRLNRNLKPIKNYVNKDLYNPP